MGVTPDRFAELAEKHGADRGFRIAAEAMPQEALLDGANCANRKLTEPYKGHGRS